MDCTVSLLYIICVHRIHSIDREYNALSMNTLTITVEDNEKCRYCGVGNIEPFNPEPKPIFWDFKSIAILSAFLLMIVFLARRAYLWFKSKYGVRFVHDTVVTYLMYFLFNTAVNMTS